MSDNERYFIQKLLAVESEGLPVKDRARIFKAFKDDKINFNNLQSCLDKINTMRHPDW
jgi:hypothetical protein|tara:strand:- start:47 stop:220 length:174 start_codon:yes stop_codon:yes gene_type:complete